MVRVKHITKDWKEAGSFPAQINLYGFWDEHSFLTKSGDLGAVLKIGGIDYESLDHAGRDYAVNSAHGQPYVLFEGTTIDTSLVTRLDGEFVGSVKVMVTNPVYSRDRQHVLIPEGTFFLGNAQKVSGFGQKRLAVAFHRMIMPDGYNVDLDQFHGLDQAGDPLAL